MTTKTKRPLGGRPQHKPTARDRKLVELLAGLGVPHTKIADVVEVDAKTLRKHYHQEMQRGSSMVEATLCARLMRLASGSDATALRACIFMLRTRFNWSEYHPPRPPEPIGKKARAQLDAETALEDDEHTEWSDLLLQ